VSLFTADLVLCGHTGQWKHDRLGKVDFVNVGALTAIEQLGFAILQGQDGHLRVQFRSYLCPNDPRELKMKKVTVDLLVTDFHQ